MYILLILSILLIPQSIFTQVTDAQADSGWANVFNGVDGEGMFTFLEGQGRDSDPEGVFTFEDGLIKVKQGPRGYIGSVDTFNYYIVRAEFQFQNPGNEGQNAGLLYHVREFQPKRQGVWPVSVESQMQKRGVGEAWTIFGTRLETTTEDPDQPCKYDPDGFEINHGANEGANVGRQCLGSSNPYVDEEWNFSEVRAYGSDSVVHIVNGQVTFRGWNLRKAGNFEDMSDPLTGGNVAVQSEGAVIHYRNFIVQELDPETHEPLYATRGCTVDSALNFDPGAVLDDGSCEYPVTINGFEAKPNRIVLSGNRITLWAHLFSLPRIFDVKGSELGMFKRSEPGIYTYTLDNEGIYFVRFAVDEKTITEKFIYLKK